MRKILPLYHIIIKNRFLPIAGLFWYTVAMKTFISLCNKYISAVFQDPRKRTFFLFGILVVSVILLYLSVFNNPFVWDDFFVVVKNTYVHNGNLLNFFSENTYSGSGSLGANWRPFMLSVFSALWHFWGGWTVPYHSASIFLHAINALLVFVFFKKNFTERYWPAFLSALLFAVHPLQTQAIVYIAGFGDPLSAFFILSGAIFYLKAEEDEEKRRGYLGVSWLCLLFAFFSKENSVMMLGLLFLADFFFSNKKETFREKLKHSLKKITPFFLLFACYIVARTTFLNFMPNVYNSSFSTSFIERVLVFFSTITDYFRLIFVPLHLHMEHTVYEVRSLFEPKAFIGFTIIASFFALIISQWKKRPEVTFGLSWFLIAYSPNANLFMPNTNLFGEHWLYLSLPGLFFVIFCLGEEFLFSRRFFLVAVFSLFAWIGWISFLTVNRNFDWETPIGILEQTHREEPKKVQATIVLGSLYRDKGEYEKALGIYAEAVSSDPNDFMVYAERADLYKKLGDSKNMIADMERSVQNSVTYSPSFDSLLTYYQKNKEFDKAEKLLNDRLHQEKDPKIVFYTSIRLVSLAVGKGDHVLTQKYLSMADGYEKEYQKGWHSWLSRWMVQ